MLIAFNCPGCGQGYKVADNLAGQAISCKKCGIRVSIPATTTITQQPLSPELVSDVPPLAGELVSKPRRLKKKKSSLVLAIVATCLFFGCLLPGAVGVGVYLWLTGSPGVGDGMKFLPANCQIIVSFRMDEIMSSDLYRDFEKQFADMVKQQGMALAPADVSRVLVGSNPHNRESVVIVMTKKAMTAEEILANLKSQTHKTEKVGSYTLYQFDKPNPFDHVVDGIPPAVPVEANPPVEMPLRQAFCVVDAKLVILGETVTLRAVLQRDKAPELSAGMKAVMKHADFSKPIALAFHVKDTLAANNPGFEVDPFGVQKNISKVEGVAVNVSLRSDVTINATVLCQDTQSAEDVRKMADGGITMTKLAPGMNADITQVIGSIKLANSGALVTASVTIPGDVVRKNMRALPRLGG